MRLGDREIKSKPNSMKGYIMTKKELIEQVQNLLEPEANPETIQSVIELIQNVGRRTSTARPKVIEKDGKTYHWCNRHRQYEPIEWFLPHPKDKDKPRPECAAATFRWQAYGKELNRAIKNGDAEATGKLTLLRKSPDGYDLKKDVKEFTEKLAEYGISIDPKEAIKEEA